MVVLESFYGILSGYVHVGIPVEAGYVNAVEYVDEGAHAPEGGSGGAVAAAAQQIAVYDAFDDDLVMNLSGRRC